jgi:hypothetical protein
MDEEFTARLLSQDNEAQPELALVDRWGRTRQRITIDDTMHPVASEWFDRNQNSLYSLTVTGKQTIDGFTLPKRIDLFGASGERVSFTLDRYEANVRLNENLFFQAPPSS